MKFTHPNGYKDIFAVLGTFMLAEVEITRQGLPGWTTFGDIGERSITIDADEWAAFVELVNEIDADRRTK